ncbi:MAG: ATP-binding protein [Candidatus Cloacimonetes bacterium]|jgi:ABC-type cobalamin/Fe3+-siderophores transport system ATPase subunit|nr:ATP-binding protein [Candidatus Cloacimonadota bacterium]HOY84019.1 AAA family ATPase [Candidatus Syntrophosphaera sp.]
MIKSLYLKNFTVFDDLRIDLSNKINIIMGVNGTGKTHILKVLYAMCKANGDVSADNNMSEEEKRDISSSMITGVFKPLDGVLGNLKKTGSKGGNAIVEIEYPDNAKFGLSFNANKQASGNGDAIKDLFNHTYESVYVPIDAHPVFIPAKEIISFMAGLPALVQKYELSFDMTYTDLMSQLEIPAIQKSLRTIRTDAIMEEIEKICVGRFEFKGGGNVTFKADKAEYSANVTAEGFRKLGTLYRLIETGALRPGVGGPLFWDEPDANLNPLQVKGVVDALYSLAQSEQQVVLATHNYNLIKWFDLLFDKDRGDHVRYHVLYRDKGVIRVNSTDDFDSIDPNPILDAFSELYDEELERYV